MIRGRTLQAQYTHQTRGSVHFRHVAQRTGVEARCYCLGGVACVEFHDENVFEIARRLILDWVRQEDELSRPVDEAFPQSPCNIPHDHVGFFVASDLDMQEVCRSRSSWANISEVLVYIECCPYLVYLGSRPMRDTDLSGSDLLLHKCRE